MVGIAADQSKQFINSVLSSIGDKGQAQPPLRKPDINGAKSDRPALDREITNKSLITQALPPSNKRKAEDALPKANEKVPKTVPSGVSESTNGCSAKPKESRISATEPSLSRKPSLQTVPYRGTSRPSAPDGAIPNKAPTKDIKRTAQANTASTRSLPADGTDSTLKVVSPTTPVPEGGKAPKKGSYAEIMARAKAAANAPAVGVIKHQPMDKKALGDRKDLQKRGLGGKQKSSAKNGHSRTSSADVSGESRPGSSGRQDGAAKKKAPEIAYKGTAKPKPQPTYKGTMKPAPSVALPARKKSFIVQDDRSRSNPVNRPKHRPQAYSEDEDQEEEEEYESESDMEAGYSDVEQEETKATKIARKEDEFEARMEYEMKRQKEARKRREAEIARNQRRDNYDDY